MNSPTISQKAPYPVEVNAGEKYYWCSCGLSANQPFCDGSHQGTKFVPIEFEASESRQLFFCGCKHSGEQALCDGTHARL